MNQRVQEWIAEQEKLLRAREKTDKKTVLLEEGLIEKEYGPLKEYSDAYPNFDEKTGQYYKAKLVDVTDEEYAEILKYRKLAGKDKAETAKKRNTVAGIFKGLAYFEFVAAFIAGLAIEGAMLIAWAAGFISGMLLLGIAEIIQLLSDIKYGEK